MPLCKWKMGGKGLDEDILKEAITLKIALVDNPC